jgi:hypothetical protein
VTLQEKQKMDRNYLAAKISILIAVLGYFAYALYWLVREIPWVVQITLNPSTYSPPGKFIATTPFNLSIEYLMEYSNFFGFLIRVVGASLALLAIILILKNGTNSLSTVKGKISKALIFEGIYFLTLIPGIYYLTFLTVEPLYTKVFLSAELLVQILLISPFLIALGLKVRKYTPGGPSFLRLIGLSAMSYVAALWLSYILKWFEVALEMGGLFWFLIPSSSLAFLDAVIVLSLAAVFAAAGFICILRKGGGGNTMRWWGLSAIFLSIYMIVYVYYCLTVPIYYMIPFAELWVIPLIGIGVYLLIKNPKIKALPV